MLSLERLSRRCLLGRSPAHRPLGHGASGRIDRALPGRRSRGRDRRHEPRAGDRADGLGARPGHDASAARRSPVDPEYRARPLRAVGEGESETQPLARDLPGAARAHPFGSQLDRVREQPRTLRTSGASAERAGGRAARARASRQPRARQAQTDRRGARSGRAARDRRDQLPRARHRHGGGRAGDARRESRRRGARAAADRSSGTRRRRDQPRRRVPEASRRPARGCGGREGHARGRGRGDRGAA